MTLAKLIIAAAWVNGEVTHDEVNSLKDLLFHLKDLTARDWSELEIYLDSPIHTAERNRLVAELQAAINSPQDKALALMALNEMIEADGEVTEEERVVAQEIEAAIEAVDVSIFGQMGRLMRGPLRRRQQVFAEPHNRELYMEDFLRNRIYFQVRRRLDLGEVELDLPQEDLRKLSLAGGLMARVAHVDREVTESEFSAMVDALRKDWGLAREAATFVTEIALSEFGAELDHYRLNREFFTATSEQERVRFMDALFAVAKADGEISHRETEEIRLISLGLKLTHQQFIQAKLRAKQ
ncbi:MAG TPA: hypothetical protein G4O11_02010 [Anaerolineae bacterium]|nr:hypothetical protein [Anaerolineae bacterium]